MNAFTNSVHSIITSVTAVYLLWGVRGEWLVCGVWRGAVFGVCICTQESEGDEGPHYPAPTPNRSALENHHPELYTLNTMLLSTMAVLFRDFYSCRIWLNYPQTSFLLKSFFKHHTILCKHLVIFKLYFIIWSLQTHICTHTHTLPNIDLEFDWASHSRQTLVDNTRTLK